MRRFVLIVQKKDTIAVHLKKGKAKKGDKIYGESKEIASKPGRAAAGLSALQLR